LEPEPSCSVIIRAFNEEKHIGRLLSGLLQQTVKDVEIILVDSGSTDATVAIASRYPAKVVSIDPGDFTFGRSLNVGCAQAHGNYIVIASAHVYPVFPDWIEELLGPFSDPEIALVYGKQRGNASTKFSEHQHFSKLYPNESKQRQELPFCNNANAAIRRELWQSRPYDEELPGLEDLEWATWAVLQGYLLSYSAEAEVVHVHEEQPREVYNRFRREAVAIKRIRPSERFSLWDLCRLYLANVLSDLRNAIREGRPVATSASIFSYRWMQFWGTYRGFSQIGPLTSQLKQTFYYPRGLDSKPTSQQRQKSPIDYGAMREAGRGDPPSE
jgi:glycosyltransferase involved in cell wall biosynthesis